MGIPAPLAYPPTALRNISAGLVVGNPVGSSGTRAKALTSAELKAIVEASGISYLPLAGGTLTGPIVANADIALMFTKRLFVSNGDTSGNYLLAGATAGLVSNTVAQAGWNTNGFFARRLILDYANADVILERGGNGILEQRNGLTAQCFDLFETYTSGTNNGKLRFKATSSGHQIGSGKGSAGGSNRSIQIGHFDGSGVFTAAMEIGTTAMVSCLNGILRLDSRLTGGGTLFSNASDTINVQLNSSVAKYAFHNSKDRLIANKDCGFGWCSATDMVAVSHAVDLAVNRSSAGVMEVNNGTVGTYRDLLIRALTGSGDLTFVPSSSRSLATNGQFAIEMTSNTAGNLVYRGI